ncbi:MAG: family peptidase [Rhodospirillales bacterium]|nr:family peptidase [Rhodospirillales bacterium]
MKCALSFYALSTIAVLLSAAPAHADGPVPIEAYGKLPAIEGPRLSPDGNTIAFLSSINGRRCLVIHRLDSDRPNHGICPGNYEVRSFSWKNADRLIMDVYVQSRPVGSELRTESRLLAIDLNGRRGVPLMESRAERSVDFGQDRIIDMLPEDPGHVLIAAYRADADSPDVVKVDIDTGHRHTIVTGQNRITNWKTDASGQVRLGTAVQDGILSTYYRNDADSPFRIIRQVEAANASKFSPLAVGSDPGTLYVASTEPTGRRAIYRYDVKTDRLLEPYASNPDVDIDSLVVDRGTPLGYGFTTDEPNLVYTDSAFRADAQQVAAALPQFRTTVVDSAAGGRRLLVLAAGGNRPGSYYVLTRADGKATLAPLGAIHPDIPDGALAPVSPVTYQSRDGLTIHGYVTLPPGMSVSDKRPIPFVVLPHGGPSARDSLGFDYLAQMIASRGFGVFQPNYRGSRGYGGAFERAGFQQWGLKMQDDVTDGTQWLINQKLAVPGRICIVGWSYGGYVALMGAIKTPGLYRCAVSMAGVTDLRRRLDRANQSRFADLNLPRFDSDPAVIEANSPVLHADQVRIPVLLAHGRRDFTVSVFDSEDMEAALKKAGKPVKSLYFDDDDHYLFREEDRIAFLKALDGFLAENLGSRVSSTPGATATN